MCDRKLSLKFPAKVPQNDTQCLDGKCPMWKALTVISVLAHLQLLSACDCKQQHPQSQFCSADFAIVATIVGNKNESTYTFQITKKLKVNNKAKTLIKFNREITVLSEENCTRSLQLNESYVLAGSVSRRQLVVEPCQLVIQESTLTPSRFNLITLHYPWSCYCEVLKGPPPLGIPPFRSSCLWDTLPYNGFHEDCLGQYAVCLVGRANTCRWNGDSDFHNCMAKNVK